MPSRRKVLIATVQLVDIGHRINVGKQAPDLFKFSRSIGREWVGTFELLSCQQPV